MRIMALDLGERRIGVAVSDPTGTVARPLCTIQRSPSVDEFGVIGDLVAEQAAELVVVGQPLTLRGEVGPQAEIVQSYASDLAGALQVPVRMWDERYSTVTAEEILNRNRKRKRGSREQEGVDAVAAAVILQAYLDSAATGLVEPLRAEPSG